MWRQTAAIPQDSRLNVAPRRSTVGEGGLIWCKTPAWKQTGCCYDRETWWISSLFGPDKGRLCAHYICSVPAGSPCTQRKTECVDMGASKEMLQKKNVRNCCGKARSERTHSNLLKKEWILACLSSTVMFHQPLMATAAWRIHSCPSTWLLTSIVFGLQFPGKWRHSLTNVLLTEGLCSIDFLPSTLLG